MAGEDRMGPFETEERRAFRETLRAFVAKEVPLRHARAHRLAEGAALLGSRPVCSVE